MKAQSGLGFYSLLFNRFHCNKYRGLKVIGHSSLRKLHTSFILVMVICYCWSIECAFLIFNEEWVMLRLNIYVSVCIQNITYVWSSAMICYSGINYENPVNVIVYRNSCGYFGIQATIVVNCRIFSARDCHRFRNLSSQKWVASSNARHRHVDTDRFFCGHPSNFGWRK